MDIHVRTLSTAEHPIRGAQLAAHRTGFLSFMVDRSAFTSSMDDNIGGVLLASSAMFHIFLAVPCIVAGIHLRSYHGMGTRRSDCHVRAEHLEYSGGFDPRRAMACGSSSRRKRTLCSPNPPPNREPKKVASGCCDAMRAQTKPKKVGGNHDRSVSAELDIVTSTILSVPGA